MKLSFKHAHWGPSHLNFFPLRSWPYDNMHAHHFMLLLNVMENFDL